MAACRGIGGQLVAAKKRKSLAAWPGINAAVAHKRRNRSLSAARGSIGGGASAALAAAQRLALRAGVTASPARRIISMARCQSHRCQQPQQRAYQR